MNIATKIMLLTATCLAMGCASMPPASSNPSAASMENCLDPTKQVRDFEVQSDRQLTVNYLGGKTYRVTLRNECPGLNDVERVSFATGPDRYVGQNSTGAVYATPVDYGRVCGRAGDRVVIRERFQDFSRPSEGCIIQYVERVR